MLNVCYILEDLSTDSPTGSGENRQRDYGASVGISGQYMCPAFTAQPHSVGRNSASPEGWTGDWSGRPELLVVAVCRELVFRDVHPFELFLLGCPDTHGGFKEQEQGKAGHQAPSKHHSHAD